MEQISLLNDSPVGALYIIIYIKYRISNSPTTLYQNHQKKQCNSVIA